MRRFQISQHASGDWFLFEMIDGKPALQIAQATPATPDGDGWLVDRTVSDGVGVALGSALDEFFEQEAAQNRADNAERAHFASNGQ
jgi:hypothetical protein